MPLDPITRSITVKWNRPRYELLDSRGKLVAALDEVGDVEAFGSDDDSLSVRFADGLTADIRLLTVTVMVPVASPPDIYRRHVEAVAVTLGEVPARIDLSLQNLIPWTIESDPVKAQLEAASHLSGIRSAIDFAFLLDGVRDENWNYKAEFGVVSATEVLDRLRRLGGRALGPLMNIADSPDGLAPVSTFVDSHWMIQTPVDVSSDGCWVEVARVDDYASNLAVDLHTQTQHRLEEDLGDSA